MERRSGAVALGVMAVVAAVAAATLAGAGGATTAATTRLAAGAQRLAIGDSIDVKGTRILCLALVSSKKPGIGCVLWKKDAPLPGSYTVGLATDGSVVLSQLRADGTAKQLLKRLPQAAGRHAGKQYVGLPGDSFGLPIDKTHILGCRVIDVKAGQAAPLYTGIKIGCWRANNTYPVPNSDGIEISDKFASVYRFDAKGNVVAGIMVKRQPA